MTARRLHSYMYRLAATLALAAGSSDLVAQTWREIATDDDLASSSIKTPRKLMIDESSISAVGGSKSVTFRYRTVGPSITDASKLLTLENEVNVDCTLMAERTLKVQGIHQGYTTPVEISKLMAKVIAVDPFSSAGRAAIFACDAGLPGSLDQFRSVPTPSECANTTSPLDFALCKDDALRIQIGIVQERVRSVAKVCGYQPAYAEMLDRATKRARGCIARSACVRRALGPLELAVRSDASRLAAGEPLRTEGDCESARSIRRTLAQEHQREQAALELKAAESALSSCAAKAWRRFDDGVSGAETVAKVAVASCKNELNRLAVAALNHEPAFSDSAIRSRLTEDLVTVVLENRVKKKAR